MEDIKPASLNKSCFVHKPEKSKKKINIASWHQKDFKYVLWAEIEEKIQNIEKRFYKDTFLNGIVDFINRSYNFPLQEIYEVPTAVLVMGVNMPDHSHIFNLLEEHLHLNNIYSTVILESKKCSNMSNTFQVIFSEIIRKFKIFLDIDIEHPKKQECSLSKLYEYYQNFPVKKHQAKKSDTCVQAKDMSKALVFLVQDVESFSTEVLLELILLSKIYSCKLPIVLILGMASAMVTLHNILPQKALCCLGVETFYSVSPSEYLTEIIQEIIMSPSIPFKFGHKVFKMIVDTVLYHDFSVSNLMYMLKFALIEHFYDKNYTSLCCHEAEIEEKVDCLDKKALEELKELPSLKMYLENNPKYTSCLKDLTAFKESVIGFVQKLFHHQKVTLIILKVLHCFVKDLPGYPLGKQLRELYSAYLEKEMGQSNAFAEAVKLLRMQSHQSLKLKLESCSAVLNDVKLESHTLSNVKEMVRSSLEKLSKLTTDDFEKNTQTPLLLESEKITSRFQLQEKIQMSLKMKRSNFEALKTSIIDDFLVIFKSISPPSHLPLYEIFYFDDVSSLKRHLMAVPRVTSCHSLASPHHYLKCSCCKVSVSEEIQPSMPDICILYKLHLECGKLINLYDWLEAFKAIKVNEENVTKRSRSKNKGSEDELNIRFLLAVSELQMLGFIKPTKRKTDHVARVTFGSF